MALIPLRRPHSALFELQPLESRVFLSADAATPAADAVPFAATAAVQPAVSLQALAPADVLTKGMRQNLLNHWTGVNRASLQAKLNANQLGAFDAALLEYMRERPGQTFVFKQSDVGEIVDFINDELSTAFVIGHADDLVAHRFPEQGNSDSY